MLLENHGALAVGSDVITAFYRMESLELWAKITINAVILGGSHDISETIFKSSLICGAITESPAVTRATSNLTRMTNCCTRKTKE